MKTFFATLAAAFILVSNSAFAAHEGASARSNVPAINITLNQYTAAVAHGKVDHLNKLFSEQFNQRYTNGKKNSTFSKEQMLGFLKAHKNIQQQCETDYSIVDENKGVAVAKVVMRYETGKRVDYVTVAQNENGYQITQVITAFE